MDNLRKSFRASFRKRKDKDQDKDFVRERTGGSGKSKLWQQDEIAVRAGTCSFDVKYLGCIEVFDSRGMPVCEEALKKLKNSKKKSIRSILYINGKTFIYMLEQFSFLKYPTRLESKQFSVWKTKTQSRSKLFRENNC